MDVDSSQQRMAAYMRDHQDKVVGRWTELVVAGLRGRSSVAEVRRELEDLYSLVVRAMSGADEQAAGELTAVLADLSRSRARNGFTPRETAVRLRAVSKPRRYTRTDHTEVITLVRFVARLSLAERRVTKRDKAKAASGGTGSRRP